MPDVGDTASVAELASAVAHVDLEPPTRPSRAFFRDDHDAQHSWSTAKTPFEVRSKTYATDRMKAPTQAPLLTLVDVDIVDLVACDSRQARLASFPDSYAAYLRRCGDKRRVLVVTWQLHPRYLVLTFVEDRDCACEASRLFDRFVDEWSADERARRFKLLPHINNFRIPGVNLNRPCIIAKKITSEFHCRAGDRLIEVDINVYSSRVARFILSYVERGAAALIIELAFTLEGNTEDELPERVLGGARLTKVDLSRTRKSHYNPDKHQHVFI